MKVLAIHRIMPILLLLLTASWGLIALFDMFEAGIITHLLRKVKISVFVKRPVLGWAKIRGILWKCPFLRQNLTKFCSLLPKCEQFLRNGQFWI
jgi:hypothetical protein